ncbi:beta-propeller fold lactonase family protein [Natrarchaeobaculum sulfurireducens]|uniref:Secreted protein with beta-propeller repeat domain n=1 Tax=Natrarchaeobaculum sulfurireducens TaxID=2044521 RepID=A0A346PCA6_9EURY|nr:hypothetical protein [Natrarchaeobaculum sulfurireducens]AXR77151.1 Secreted protein with beta-propeller repeat domain [Natrarchaeobaculum sulfurireducens]
MHKELNRRRFVQVAAGGTVVALAGCLGDDDDDEELEESADDSDGHDDHEDDGDNDDGEFEGSEGMIYAFAPNTIAIIDPEDGEVVDEITDGLDDEGWGDPRITADYSEIYVIRESPSQVLVIDTKAREIVDEVDIGPDATHMYHPNDEEMWAHSDDEGTFYVIDTDSHDVTEIVESGLENEGHGKLLYHEDFGSTAYATNVNDPGVAVIDLESYERSDFIEFADEDDQGTHYKAYSPENGRAYVEFGDETVVVDTETDEIVDTFDFAGGMYLSSDEQVLGVLDGDEVRFLDATSEDSEELGVVPVGDGPDALRYHESEDTRYAITAHTQTDEASIIDVDELEVVDIVDVGDIERPEDAHHLHRSGVAGDGYFVTPADADGIVAVVDIEASEVEHVEVEDGVDTVQYVGDSGVGYSGRLR